MSTSGILSRICGELFSYDYQRDVSPRREYRFSVSAKKLAFSRYDSKLNRQWVELFPVLGSVVCLKSLKKQMSRVVDNLSMQSNIGRE